MEHRVLGVLGASGGLGASTLAVALALRASSAVGATACVDSVFERGGLDVTACLEHVDGLRWSDLAQLSGEVDAADLLRSLPADGVLRVLGARGQEPPADVVETCVRALSSLCGMTVLDLGGSLRWAGLCSDVVLLSGVTARHLADASAMAEALGGPRRTGGAGPGGSGSWGAGSWGGGSSGGGSSGAGPAGSLVLRAGRREVVTAEEVAVHLDLPWAATLRDDPRVATDADRARVPGTRRTGALVEAVDRVLAHLDLGAGRLTA